MQIIFLIILICINAFFAASEIAFISLNDLKVEKDAKDNNKKAIKIKKMLKNPSEFLATIQIGITLAGFLSSAFASETFADKLAPILNSWVPYLSVEIWKVISVILITIVLSYFTLVFGELVPKRLAMKNSEKIAYATIGVVSFISKVTRPFVKLLTASTNAISKILGVNQNEEETVTEEEIRMMVDVGQQNGVIEDNEKEFINNVFEFNDKDVSEVMVHRTDIRAIDGDLSINEAIQDLSENCRNSRIPVYEDDIDKIIGVISIRDLLFSSKNKNTRIKNICRPVYRVPETKALDELFREMQKNKNQLAIVIDEYGGTAGLVTMEDILEELVGDIYDEYDTVEKKYEKLDDNTFILKGNLNIYEVEKILNIDIEEEYADTLSGHLLEYLGRIPKEKERAQVEIENVVYTIEKIKDNKILKVRAQKLNQKSDSKDSSDTEK